MKSKFVLKVGDVVKSLDFVSRKDCYYVGVVISVDRVRGIFRAKTLQRVWGGEEVSLRNNNFEAPLPGNMLIDDPARIEQVS